LSAIRSLTAIARNVDQNVININRNIQSSLTLNDTAYDTFVIRLDVARTNRAVPASRDLGQVQPKLPAADPYISCRKSKNEVVSIGPARRGRKIKEFPAREFVVYDAFYAECLR